MYCPFTLVCVHCIRNIKYVTKSIVVVLQNQRLVVCKSAEKARELVRDNAKLDDRRGDQATPLIVQVCTYIPYIAHNSKSYSIL